MSRPLCTEKNGMQHINNQIGVTQELEKSQLK